MKDMKYMKYIKIKLLVLVLVGLLSGCNGTEQKKNEVTVQYSKDYLESPVYKFDFENHQYICFDRGSAKSIVHNPECLNVKCNK